MCPVSWAATLRDRRRFFFEETAVFLKLEKGKPSLLRENAFLPLRKEHREAGMMLVKGDPLLKKGLVVIHPGSGGVRKCWPLENFFEIISRLECAGYQGIVVTGPAEESMEKSLERCGIPDSWTWLRSPALTSLAGIISCAALYIGNDSGITHLAAACKIPVIALFLKEFERQWMPYGDVCVLAAEEIEQIPVDSLWKQVRSSECFKK